jgi:exosortase A
MPRQSRRILVVLLAILLLALVWAYRTTVQSMVDTWYNDSAFTYGFVVIPISIWIIWERRSWLSRVSLTPSWLGVLIMLAVTALWVVARGTGVRVVEQFAFAAMLPTAVLAVLGWQAMRALLFPLAFLLFMVPVGRALVPWMVNGTADIATWALQASGIPVWRSHVYISIPDGSFEVAKACSGIAFLSTSTVLGVLYAHLNYSVWRKRLLFLLAVIAVPVIANGIRIYITIAVSHLTHMQFGPGVEHVEFARIFFIAVMLLVGWVGLRWRDPDPGMPEWLQSSRRVEGAERLSAVGISAVIAVAFIALSAPVYQRAFAGKLLERHAGAWASVKLPTGRNGWRGPSVEPQSWRPLYRNGLVELSGRYLGPAGEQVDAFVAVYGLGATAGTEMISYGNVLHAGEHSTVPDTTHRLMDIGGGRTLAVREVRVPGDNGGYLVWHWYMFGDRPVTNPFAVKALEALAWGARNAVNERIVTLATPLDEQAIVRLQAFLAAHLECVERGFSAEACSG